MSNYKVANQFEDNCGRKNLGGQLISLTRKTKLHITALKVAPFAQLIMLCNWCVIFFLIFIYLWKLWIIISTVLTLTFVFCSCIASCYYINLLCNTILKVYIHIEEIFLIVLHWCLNHNHLNHYIKQLTSIFWSWTTIKGWLLIKCVTISYFVIKFKSL